MPQQLVHEQTNDGRTILVVATDKLQNRNEVIGAFRELITEHFGWKPEVTAALREFEMKWIAIGRVHHETLSALLGFEDEFRKHSGDNHKLSAGKVRALINALKDDLEKGFQAARDR